MSIKHRFAICLIVFNVALSANPIFVKIQSSDTLINFPTIDSISDAQILFTDGTTMNIEDINSVELYKKKSLLLAKLAEHGCGYLVFMSGVYFSYIIFREWEIDIKNLNMPYVLSIAGGITSGAYAYQRVAMFIASKSFTQIVMDDWTLEQKRDFFYQILSNS